MAELEFGTPEHRAALAARHGKPHGSHIRETSSPDDVVSYDATIIELMERMAQLERQTASSSDEDGSVTVPRPQFDAKISLGNILTILAMFVGFAVGWTNFVSTVSAEKVQIDTNQADLVNIRKEADDRVQKYVPTIEAQQRENEVQDTRVQNLAVSMADLRKTVSDLATIVAQTHEDIAVLKVQLGRDGSKGMPGR